MRPNRCNENNQLAGNVIFAHPMANRLISTVQKMKCWPLKNERFQVILAHREAKESEKTGI